MGGEIGGLATEVTIWYLELNRVEFRPSAPPPEPIEVRKAEIPLPALNRFMYLEVGRDWTWTDRLAWTRDEWHAWAHQTDLETWVGYVRGTPFGYAEIIGPIDGSVEIASFGLLPPFVGRGFGGALLSEIIRIGFDAGVHRVWLHTCSLDHPSAVPNYKKRGMREFDRKVVLQEIPVRPDYL